MNHKLFCIHGHSIAIYGRTKRGSCRECAREYLRAYAKTPMQKKKRLVWQRTVAGRAYKLRAAMARVKRHKEWIDAYKLQKGCETCGFNKWPECLDFDHRNPKAKLFNISQKLGWAVTRLQKEISKCRVLCANCHRHHSKITHWRTLCA